MKKYLLLATLLLTTTTLFVQTTNAGLVPGMIVKDSSTSPAYDCNHTTVGGTSWPVYGCTNGSTDPGGYGCKTLTPVANYCYTHFNYTCTGPSLPTLTGNGATPQQCAADYSPYTCVCSGGYDYTADAVICGTTNVCTAYYTQPYITNYITLDQVTDSFNQRYYFPEMGKTLGNQFANYCKVDATQSTYIGVGYAPPIGTTSALCERGGAVTSYAGGANGSCKFVNTNYNIPLAPVGFNQTNGFITNTNPTGTLSACTVEGLKSTVDNIGPTITSPNGTLSVFDTDADNWCNMTKYRAANYGSTTNPVLAGCTYYRGLNSHSVPGTNGLPVTNVGANPDLLEGLTINVNDPSGISEIQVEIGANCVATYTLPNNVSSIVKSVTSALGVDPNYQNITLYSTGTSTSAGGGAPGTGLPSLVSKFGVSRLDACLTEGKNYMKVTVKDNARSNSDGATYAPNQTVIDLSAGSNFIKVDNNSAKIGFTGDAKKFAISNEPLTSNFIGGATLDNRWKNFTIKGALITGDPYGGDTTDTSPVCTNLTWTGMTCTTSSTKGFIPAPPNASNHFVWTAPGGVNPTTGAFLGSICDGLGPIPDTSSCEWDCDVGYTYDSGSTACIKSSNLFILFNNGTTSPHRATLSNNTTLSHGLMNSETDVCPTPPNASSASKWKMFTYNITGNYSFPTAPIGPFPIVFNGFGMCTPICNLNYSHDGLGNCIADKRNFACNPPSPIVNTVWNTTSSINKTWNGTAWMPLTSTGAVYDTNPGDCHYKCSSSSTWSGAINTCISNMCTGSIPSFNVTWTSPTQPGVYTYVPVLSTSPSVSCEFTCNAGYTYDSVNNKCDPPASLPICKAGGTVPCVVAP